MKNLIIDPLEDGKSKVELIDFMGSDLSVVNAARSSFNKESHELTEGDIKLINYLMRERHPSPLRGVVFSFKIKAPLFIARQWWKHVVASSHVDEQLQHNEQSLRYVEVSDPEEFYIPTVFRQQSPSNRQATIGALEPEANNQAQEIYSKLCHDSYLAYQELLQLGVGREQARGVLVPSVYVTWIWTTSLQAVLHFRDLRRGKGAQSEVALYAQTIDQLIEPIVPETMKAWAIYNPVE